MRKINPYVTFAVIISVATAFSFVVSRGWYPIAVVNGHFITNEQLKIGYKASSAYFKNFVDAYNVSADKVPKIDEEDLRASTLDFLVESTLVRSEARREFGEDLEYLISTRVDKFDTDAEFQKAATALYGLDFKNVKDAVLIPQAERDVLAGNLLLRNRKIEDWIKEARRKGAIHIFSQGLYWDGERVRAASQKNKGK